MKKTESNFIQPIEPPDQNLLKESSQEQEQSTQEKPQKKKRSLQMTQALKFSIEDEDRKVEENSGNSNPESDIQKQDDKIYTQIIEQFQKLNMQNQDIVVSENSKGEFYIVPTEYKEKFSIKNLKTLGPLGRGSQSKVYKVFNQQENKIFALKEIQMSTDQIKQESIKQEIQAMISNKSQHIVQYHGAFYKEGKVNILLEYMDKGSLQDLMASVKRIPDIIFGEIIYQLLNGLAYLHKDLKIIHRDIKPANILFNTQGLVKIADFGVSGKIDYTDEIRKTWVGTLQYMSPERLSASPYTQNTDQWSLGMICLESVLGESPLKEYTQREDFFGALEKLNKFNVAEVVFPTGTSPDFISFIEKCLERDPEKRWSSKSLLEHDFVKKYHNQREKLQGVFKKWINTDTSKK